MAKPQGAKKKKKIWYNIIPPEDFGAEPIGETSAYEGTPVEGRTLKISLMELTNDMKKQNIGVTFRVREVSEKKALADLVKYELMPFYVRRMMRKGRDKVEDSFICSVKDGIKVKVKPFMITKTKVQNSILTALRKQARDFVASNAASQSFMEFMGSVITTKMQKSLREHLKKTYPLAVCEFRIVERA